MQQHGTLKYTVASAEFMSVFSNYFLNINSICLCSIFWHLFIDRINYFPEDPSDITFDEDATKHLKSIFPQPTHCR